MINKMPELTDEFIKESANILEAEFKGVEDFYVAFKMNMMLELDNDLYCLKKLTQEVVAPNEKEKHKELCDFIMYKVNYKQKLLAEVVHRMESANEKN